MPLSKCRNFKCFLHHWLLEKSLKQGLRCQHFTWEKEGWSNQDDGKKCKVLFSEQFAYLRIKMTTLRDTPWIDSLSTCKRSGRVTWRNHALEKPMRQRTQEELICLLFSRLISRTSNSPTLHSLGHPVTMAEFSLYSEGFHKSKRGDNPHVGGELNKNKKEVVKSLWESSQGLCLPNKQVIHKGQKILSYSMSSRCPTKKDDHLNPKMNKLHIKSTTLSLWFEVPNL